MERRVGEGETAGIITPKEEEGRHCTLGVGRRGRKGKGMGLREVAECLPEFNRFLGLVPVSFDSLLIHHTIQRFMKTYINYILQVQDQEQMTSKFEWIPYVICHSHRC